MIVAGRFEYFQDEKGDWLYKAIKPKKLSQKYHDLPRYKSIIVNENQFTSSFNESISDFISDINEMLL